MANELKHMELKASDKDNENAIIKQFESSMASEFFGEKQRTANDMKLLREEVKRAQAEVAKKDMEVQSLKIELEKSRVENLGLSQNHRKLEGELIRLEDQRRDRSPVMMKNERVVKAESQEKRNKKTCLLELDQMVKQYRNDQVRQRVD